MTNAQEIYAHSIRSWPTSERLRLAALILSEITAVPPHQKTPGSALALLESFPPGGMFPTPADADRYLREERDAWER